MNEPLCSYLPDGFPVGLIDQDDTTILRALARPTLVRIPAGSGPDGASSRREGSGGGGLDGGGPGGLDGGGLEGEPQAPRVVSTLLHGDEPSGFQAMVRILRRRPQLPYDLYVLIGNVRAALSPPGFAIRYLDDQEDFNRVWAPESSGTELGDAAAQMLTWLREAAPSSLVDVHNTTGDNPFYAIVTRPQPAAINLATLFTTRLVHWELPTGALVEQIHDQCTAIAVECGLANAPGALEFALDGLRRYLAAPEIEADEVQRDHDLLGGLRRVTLRDGAHLRFGGELSDEIDLVVPADADVHNFVEVAAGHTLGRAHPDRPLPLKVHDTAGRDVTSAMLSRDDDRIVLTQPATPVMMTRTAVAARKDCLVYLAVDPVRVG